MKNFIHQKTPVPINKSVGCFCYLFSWKKSKIYFIPWAGDKVASERSVLGKNNCHDDADLEPLATTWTVNLSQFPKASLLPSGLTRQPQAEFTFSP